MNQIRQKTHAQGIPDVDGFARLQAPDSSATAETETERRAKRKKHRSHAAPASSPSPSLSLLLRPHLTSPSISGEACARGGGSEGGGRREKMGPSGFAAEDPGKE